MKLHNLFYIAAPAWLFGSFWIGGYLIHDIQHRWMELPMFMTMVFGAAIGSVALYATGEVLRAKLEDEEDDKEECG